MSLHSTRAHRLAVLLACALLQLSGSAASAPDVTVNVNAAARPEPERPHALASLGGAIGGIGGYEGYGLGLLARMGVEVPLFRAGGTQHSLVPALEGARFPGWEFDTPFLFNGVQLDLASLRSNWRFYPWRGQGLYVEGGAGLLLARDRIALVLPTRNVMSTEWRSGVPIQLGTGWVVADHFDVALRYSQIVFTDKEPRSFGFLELALGGRV